MSLDIEHIKHIKHKAISLIYRSRIRLFYELYSTYFKSLLIVMITKLQSLAIK